jgi:hypothetical protein
MKICIREFENGFGRKKRNLFEAKKIDYYVLISCLGLLTMWLREVNIYNKNNNTMTSFTSTKQDLTTHIIITTPQRLSTILGFICGYLFFMFIIWVPEEQHVLRSWIELEQNLASHSDREINIIRDSVDNQDQQQDEITSTTLNPPSISPTTTTTPSPLPTKHNTINVNTSVTSNNNQTHNRILCWAPIRDANSKLLIRIHNTWGPRCDKLLFTSSTSNETLGVIQVPHVVRNSQLWAQVHAVWTYLAENYLNQDYDWFVKLDDDTYFSPDNFRYVVRNKNPKTEMVYIGHQLFNRGQSYVIGACYSISRRMLEIIAPHLPHSNQTQDVNGNLLVKCRNTHTWSEDLEFRNCLRLIDSKNWLPKYSWDRYGREYFHALHPNEVQKLLRVTNPKFWYFHNKPDFIHDGPQCCSPYPVNFHHIKESNYKLIDTLPIEMYSIDYLLYIVAIDPLPGMLLEGEER